MLVSDICKHGKRTDKGCEECETELMETLRAYTPPKEPPAASAGLPRGLKDHEIADLTNKLRNGLRPFIPHQCLREVISGILIAWAENNNLRIDKR